MDPVRFSDESDCFVVEFQNEDIDDYNRVEAMFLYFNNHRSEVNSDGEGFTKWDINANSVNAYTADYFSGVPGYQCQTVLFQPCLGLLKGKQKVHSLRYAPLTLELELVNDSNDVIVSTLDNSVTGVFKSDNTSLTWEIQNAQVKCDLLTLDNELDNSYAELLMSGKSLPINFTSYVSQVQR